MVTRKPCREATPSLVRHRTRNAHTHTDTHTHDKQMEGGRPVWDTHGLTPRSHAVHHVPPVGCRDGNIPPLHAPRDLLATPPPCH